MKRSHFAGERFDAREMSNAAFSASIFAASVGMIWDLATGHASAFDRMLSNLSDDESEATPMRRANDSRASGSSSASTAHSLHSTAQGNRSNA
jgi:hypothetical protein